MRTQIRIVAGSLRGRKVTCDVNPALRPTPQRAREAYFSIMGNAIPGRPFFDVFAGTGIVGMEALSRGASSALFIERDFRLVTDLERYLGDFQMKRIARVLRVDVYRWIDRWQPPSEPVNVFLSPPFPDLRNRQEEMLRMVGILQERLAPDSVLTLQSETAPLLDQLLEGKGWDARKYGRNHLLFWVKEQPGEAESVEEAGNGGSDAP